MTSVFLIILFWKYSLAGYLLWIISDILVYWGQLRKDRRLALEREQKWERIKARQARMVTTLRDVN